MSKIQKYGHVDVAGGGCVTYELIDRVSATGIESDKESFMQNEGFKYAQHFNFKDFTVAAHGENNNLPKDAVNFIRYNPYLPEILKKQVRILIGQGPFLYQEDYDESGKKFRKPQKRETYRAVWDWLNSWKANGLPDDVQTYLKKTAFEYYFVEQYYDKVHKNKSRRIPGGLNPIRGLESMNGVNCRLAMPGNSDPSKIYTNSDFNTILFGRWDGFYRYETDVYTRFNERNPFKNAMDVAFVADRGFDEDVYSLPTYFYGLREWIKGANLNAKYINSYLKNSLSAKLHVIIPDAWIQSKIKTIQGVCDANKEREQNGDDLITTYETLTGIGTLFNHSMVLKLVEGKIREITDLMAGEGKNQGKTFWTRSFRTQYGIEEWEFKEIPVKYKEFISTLVDYDKRAMQVILAGKGLDPSISNVSSEGIFANSGSQVYYNYLVYLDTLHFAEEYICQNLNMALRINFPYLADRDIKLGFYRNKPEKQQEISPSNRLDKTISN